MIEVINAATCTSCNICVQICPTDVFERREGGNPIIARQADCQTCFMCELYCPTDALYVAPQAETAEMPAEAGLVARDLLGSYRRSIGWSGGARDRRLGDSSYIILDRYFSDTL